MFENKKILENLTKIILLKKNNGKINFKKIYFKII